MSLSETDLGARINVLSIGALCSGPVCSATFSIKLVNFMPIA